MGRESELCYSYIVWPDAIAQRAHRVNELVHHPMRESPLDSARLLSSHPRSGVPLNKRTGPRCISKQTLTKTTGLCCCGGCVFVSLSRETDRSDARPRRIPVLCRMKRAHGGDKQHLSTESPSPPVDFNPVSLLSTVFCRLSAFSRSKSPCCCLLSFLQEFHRGRGGGGKFSTNRSRLAARGNVNFPWYIFLFKKKGLVLKQSTFRRR